MRLLGASKVGGRRLQAGRKAASGLCALFSLAFAAQAWAEGTPAGTRISNVAEVSYEASNGAEFSVASDTVFVTVAQVAGVDLEPPRFSVADPGNTVYFTHTLANVGNGADSFALTATSQLGWTVRIYRDANGNGTLDAGEVEITGPVSLAADDTVRLLIAVDVPASATVRGSTDTVDVRVASAFDGSKTDELQDVIEVRDVGILVSLSKSVDRPTATIGDILSYSIPFSASGPSSADNLQISDAIPTGTSYVPGTLQLNGAPLSDGAGDDEGAFELGLNRVVFQVAAISGGETGTASFQVRIDGGVQTVQNSAAASYETIAGTDSLNSNAVQTTVVAPEFRLEKTLVGPNVATIGDEIRYQLRYGNSSTTVPAREVVISDTLPTGLEFVSSTPPAAVNDSILSWAIGDLVPGATATIDLTVRVSDGVVDTLEVSNMAVLGALNALGSEVTLSDPVQLIGVSSGQLSLDKVAEVLEVGLGEVVPYKLTVENTGTISLSDIRIHDRLPDGGRYSNGSLMGADSLTANGRDLTIYVAGPLAPGATHTVRYAVAIVSSAERTVANRAYATAEDGIVSSDEVTAWVSVRSSWPMETRAAIGKVWVDLNGDGMQQRGEPGVDGIDIWTEDGEVATSDSEGKFSFRNLRPGRHAFRMDATTIPMAYRIAGDGPTDDMLTLNSDGWTTPRINFRLIPRGATIAEVRIQLASPSAANAATPDGWMLASVHNYVIPVDSTVRVRATTDQLPNITQLPAGTGVGLTLSANAQGWPEVTFPLPSGWEPVPGSVRIGGDPAPDPELKRDRSGAPVLYWRLADRRADTIALELRPSGTIASAEVVRVASARSEEERQAERGREFIAGPGIEFFSPADGAVLNSDRVFIGVRGEPRAPVALFDGDSSIAEANLRIDGVHDFIAIPLSRGPHLLRVRMRNSWSQERWDSMAVHVTGQPAEIANEESRITLSADGQSTLTVRARVLDAWGVPVVNPVYVTVAAEGAEPLGEDADRSSVGHQLRSDAAGWLRVVLRPGLEVRRGKLVLTAGEATREIELEILPAIRPLMVTGVGRIGLGAAPDAFGSLTARGRLDERTSVLVSWDSRKLDADRDFFGRSYDPLDEAQYPLLGDASRQRAMSASQYSLSARVQRGFDWIAFGDISTDEFTSGLNLTRYHRALPGAAARLSTGPVVWNAFGSSTTQSLKQLQIRGAGISGPYELQANIRPGTDQVTIETRARENAQRVISRQALARFVDYQIDYARGTLLLKRPLPAADTYENPVFIVVTFEADGGGQHEAVWGLRAATDAAALIDFQSVDSLRVGATWISDGQSGGHQLAGADVRVMTYGGMDVQAELSYAQSPDSSDIAAAVDASVRLLEGDLKLSAGYTVVGDEYNNPSNLSLRGGTAEIRAAGGLKLGSGELRLEHQRQNFGADNVTRQRTAGGITQPLGSRFQLDAGISADHYASNGIDSESQAGELKLTWKPTPDVTLWTETRQELGQAGNVAIPDYIGGGAEYRISPKLALETQHRFVDLPGDSTSYTVTSLGVRSDLGLGTQAWGSYRIAGGVEGEHNAAVVGLNNRLRIGQDWSINTLFERRIGLNDASIADPVRALPFLQNEEDYWSAGLGVELLPADEPYRASARGEFRDGDFRSTRLFTLAGDISLNRSLALLSRSEYLRSEQSLGGADLTSERKSTLWGLAFRPVGGDALNVMTKFQWLEESNPLGGGVLASDGKEQRLIAVTEAIWAPLAWGELAGRYAIRRTETEQPLADGAGIQGLTSWADYFGSRLNIDLNRWLAFRGEGRLLVEHTSSSKRWDAAPSLVLFPVDGLEAQIGYRFGDLQDPDFAVRGGHGLFAVFSARISERSFPTSADFWRPRFGQK